MTIWLLYKNLDLFNEGFFVCCSCRKGKSTPKTALVDSSDILPANEVSKYLKTPNCILSNWVKGKEKEKTLLLHLQKLLSCVLFRPSHHTWTPSTQTKPPWTRKEPLRKIPSTTPTWTLRNSSRPPQRVKSGTASSEGRPPTR